MCKPLYAGSLAADRLVQTGIYWYAAVRNRLLYRDEDPQTVRFLLIRGLTMPLIFPPSIGVSFFSVSTAVWLWVVLVAVDAVIRHRRNR